MQKLTVLTLACAGMLFTMLPRARADEWNQKTIFTFSQPVEVPGRVLPPGTYVFKLVDSASNRNIVEVLNKRENHVYGIFLAIPDYHLKPASKTILTFEERASGAPQAVKAWFYPGDNYAHDFVYPKVKAVELAQANHAPVPSVPNETMSTTQSQSTNESQMQTMRQAPMKAENPSGSESEVAEAFPPPTSDQASNDNQPSANRQATLPTTASDLPLAGMIGMFSLIGAGLLMGFGRILRAGR